MLDLLNSVSLTSGAVVIAISCAFIVLAAGVVFKRPFSWAVVFILPFVIAYTMYWAPVWLGLDEPQHWSWSPIFIGGWYLSGVTASASAAIVVLSRKKS